VAIPERLGVKGAMAANGGLGLGPAQIIDANFSTGFATLYLLVVAAAIFVCCLSIMASTIRLCFGMSRDNTLPFSKPLAKVSPSLHTPVWTCIVIAVIAAIPFIQYSGAGIIAIAATGTIYFSYFLGNIIILRARARGWPRTRAPFRLGRWGMLVNILALIYGGAMIINFAWPRAVPFTNPKPSQSGGLLDFHIGFLNDIPILWTVFVFIVLIGVIYYLAAGRKKEFAPVIAPAGDAAPGAGQARPARAGDPHRRAPGRHVRRRAQAGAGPHHPGRVLRAAAAARDAAGRTGAVRNPAAGRPGVGGRARAGGGRPGPRGAAGAAGRWPPDRAGAVAVPGGAVPGAAPVPARRVSLRAAGDPVQPAPA